MRIILHVYRPSSKGVGNVVISYCPWMGSEKRSRKGWKMKKVGAMVKKVAALPEVRGLLMGLAMVGLGNTAHAQATTAFSRLTSAICNIYGAMSGSFGLALVIIMFAIGAISLMIGGKKAVPLMIGAAVGGVLLAAAPSFAKIFINESACGA